MRLPSTSSRINNSTRSPTSTVVASAAVAVPSWNDAARNNKSPHNLLLPQRHAMRAMIARGRSSNSMNLLVAGSPPELRRTKSLPTHLEDNSDDSTPNSNNNGTRSSTSTKSLFWFRPHPHRPLNTVATSKTTTSTTQMQEHTKRRMKVWRRSHSCITGSSSSSSSSMMSKCRAGPEPFYLPTLREGVVVEDLETKPVVFRREGSYGTVLSSDSETNSHSDDDDDDDDDERDLHGLSLLEEKEC